MSRRDYAVAVVLVGLAAALALAASAAPGLVIYRCVAPDGTVLLQNGQKCPRGMREQKRTVELPTSVGVATPGLPAAAPGGSTLPGAAPAAPQAPAASAGLSGSTAPGGSANPVAATPPTPADAAAPAVSGPSDAAPDGAAVRSEPAAAPPIYACQTPQGERYFADAAETPRCAPLAVVGLGGTGPAGAAACEMVVDRCDAVPDAERCAAWIERRHSAERLLAFSPEQVDEAREELARIEASTAGTPCAR